MHVLLIFSSGQGKEIRKLKQILFFFFEEKKRCLKYEANRRLLSYRLEVAKASLGGGSVLISLVLGVGFLSVPEKPVISVVLLNSMHMGSIRGFSFAFPCLPNHSTLRKEELYYRPFSSICVYMAFLSYNSAKKREFLRGRFISNYHLMGLEGCYMFLWL